MDIKDIRTEIDSIDSQLIDLFKRRMDCSRQVALYKTENGIPILNQEREEAVLDKVESEAGEYGSSARQLYATIMELSRALQHDMMGSGQELYNYISTAKGGLDRSDPKLRVACFGVSGTYAHQACGTFFPNAEPVFSPHFYDVFSAIQNGEADFGVVPIENSTAGSVTEVYDLMLKYRFHIAAALHIRVDHCLAAKKGTELKDIRRVYSHQQALSQCSDYLRGNRIEGVEYISTAAAARMVSASEADDIAAICSEQAAKEYGLTILDRGFQNDSGNRTRFLLITKPLYIEPEAHKISLCFPLPHRTGSLYHILCRFAVNGLNLTKIESRPKKGSSFEYIFYLDFDGNIRDTKTMSLLRALSDEIPDFSFLGNYPETTV